MSGPGPKEPADVTATVSYNAAELGALAHLYRGEMYRSKVWRTRLDGTTNWAVVTTGVGLSATFSNPRNPPLTLMLVGLLALIFLIIESRRYRYFDMWRTRVRLMEVSFFGPLLRGEGIRTENGWHHALARDYQDLRFHISYLEAFGRRFWRNYVWLFVVLGLSYLGKILIHPAPARSLRALWENAAVGPVPGQVVIGLVAVFYAGLFVAGSVAARRTEASGRVHGPVDEDPLGRFGLRL